MAKVVRKIQGKKVIRFVGNVATCCSLILLANSSTVALNHREQNALY